MNRLSDSLLLTTNPHLAYRLEITDGKLKESMRKRYGRNKDFFFLLFGTVVPHAGKDTKLFYKVRTWHKGKVENE